MPASPTFNAGEVFRTDCPDTFNAYWRMLVGDTVIGYIWNNYNNHHLNIQVDQTDGNIDFYTSPSTPSTGVLRMTIIPNGNVGIGTVSFPPAFKLDVNGGDINVNTDSNGYRIDSDYVLWHNGDIRNIYVGVGAGISNTGFCNTFIGHVAGNKQYNWLLEYFFR